MRGDHSSGDEDYGGGVEKSHNLITTSNLSKFINFICPQLVLGQQLSKLTTTYSTMARRSNEN